jgi:hypothetical protein
MGKEIPGIGLDDLPVKVSGFLQTPALVTSGRLVAESLQIHPVHPGRAQGLSLLQAGPLFNSWGARGPKKNMAATG